MKRLVIVALASLLLVGCSSTPAPEDVPAVPLPMPIDEGIGGEVPAILLVAPQTGVGFEALISGELGLNEYTCVTIGDKLLVAPFGSQIDGTTVSLAGYGSFELGTSITPSAGGSETIAVAEATPEMVTCIPGDATEVTYTVISPKAR